MKIVYITSSLDEQTGVGRHSSAIVNGLKKLGHNVEVIMDDDDDSYREGSRLIKFFKLITYLKKQSRKAKKTARDADIIHAHDIFPHALAGAAIVKPRQKFFINGIGTDSVARLNKFFLGIKMKKALLRADKVFCISNYTKKKIKEKAPRAGNLEVVHLGVDFDKFYFNLSEKKFFSSSQDDPVILGVGMVKRRKGYDSAIKAIAGVKKTYPQVRYKIIGDKEQSGYIWHLEQLVKKLGLEQNIEFLGKISEQELIQEYKSADLFLLPSKNIGDHFEGFGLVYLEANSAGLPAIGSYETGAEDAIKNGQSGFLFRQGDHKAIAKKITELLQDEKGLKEISRQAQEWARGFKWERTVESYLDFYKAVY